MFHSHSVSVPTTPLTRPAAKATISSPLELPDATASFIFLNLVTAFLAFLVTLSPSFAEEQVMFTEGTLTKKGKAIFLKAQEYAEIQKKESDIYHANPELYPLNKSNSISIGNYNIDMLNGFNCTLNVNHVLNAVDDPNYDLRTWGNSLQGNLMGLNRLYSYADEYTDSQRRSVVLRKNNENYSGIKFVWFKRNEISGFMNFHEFLNESGLNKGIPVGSVVLAYQFYEGKNGCNISYEASGHAGIVGGNIGNKDVIITNKGKTYQVNDLQNIILYHSNWAIDNVSHENQWVPDPWITLMFSGNQNDRTIEDYQVNSRFSTIRPDDRCFDKLEIIVPKDIWNEYSVAIKRSNISQPRLSPVSPNHYKSGSLNKGGIYEPQVNPEVRATYSPAGGEDAVPPPPGGPGWAIPAFLPRYERRPPFPQPAGPRAGEGK